VARATLGNERVSIGSGRSTVRNTDARSLVEVAQRQGPADPGIARDVGALLAEGQAIRMINLRTVSRAVIGVEPSPEGNVTKLLNSEHAQRVAELAMVISGPTGAVTDAEQSPVLQWIGVRGLTIAGGTSEIGRNQIGERLLGLPREPGLR
jgi:alkylation response protein AidB-like acyl-CoA dehydrogenase